jgi:hypothetical protein
VDALRPDQVALLAEHRFHAHDLVEALYAEVAESHGYPDPSSAALQALLDSEQGLQVSCAIALLAAEHDRIEALPDPPPESEIATSVAQAIEDALAGKAEWNSMLVLSGALQTLLGRRPPFSASDVELMLDIGVDRTGFWLFPYTVAAAERVLAAEPGSPAVLAALERATGRLDDHWRASYDADLRAARGRIRALLAANLPAGLLDLSVVSDGDAWAEPARAVLAGHDKRWEGVPDALALFAAARTSKPTKKWDARCAELLDGRPELPSLSRELLELVLEIDLVPTPDTVPYPPRWLLAPGNETLLKGAVWSLRNVPDDWVVPLFGRLALRGAAPSPDDGVPTPLSATVANASVDSLIARETDEARDELRRLLSELRRRDLLKRIAASLGESHDATTARDDAVRREKQRAVRAKADPRPQLEQRSLSTRVRTELAPRLRDLGFTAKKGRTFWRHQPDRVEVVHVASRRGEASVRAGVWFRGARERRTPALEDGDAYPSEAACHLLTGIDADDLAQAAVDAETWFLRWDDLAAVLSHLLSDAHEDVHVGGSGSASRDLLIGYLAPKAGRRELAAEHLSRAAAFHRELLENRRSIAPRDVTPDWEAWVDGLEADARAA